MACCPDDEIEWLAQDHKPYEYCHLCSCEIGWLHNATEHWAGEYIDHEPFLDGNCEACWQWLARVQSKPPAVNEDFQDELAWGYVPE
jgi:hypothetical protein